MMAGDAPDRRDRYRGCLLGLACGDAVGTTLEFMPRFDVMPIRDMVGGGPFALPAGAWTDDTSMALCLATSLIHCNGFDATDQMNRYCNWADYGYLSSTGYCFDIGSIVREALSRYRETGDPFSGPTDPQRAGNGCLMRLAPVPMFFGGQPEQLAHAAMESARTTHGASECLEASRLFAMQLAAALRGASKEEIISEHGCHSTEPAVIRLGYGAWRAMDEDDIAGTGYVIASLEAALWCFWHTDSFEAAILRAANLGADADTTAAICGQIAGAYYGAAAIPAHWRERLVMADEITDLADRLFALSESAGGS